MAMSKHDRLVEDLCEQIRKLLDERTLAEKMTEKRACTLCVQVLESVKVEYEMRLEEL